MEKLCFQNMNQLTKLRYKYAVIYLTQLFLFCSVGKKLKELVKITLSIIL